MTALSTDDSLLAQDVSGVGAWLAGRGYAPGLGGAVFAALHRRLGDDFSQMPGFKGAMVAAVQAAVRGESPVVAEEVWAEDGVCKWLLAFPGGGEVEVVYIPAGGAGRERGTLCLSCQTGCALGCRMCATGGLGAGRNLFAGEIAGQALVARKALWRRGMVVTNVVMMGMGEPLYNWDAVRQGLAVVAAGLGVGPGSRKVSVSTVGIAPRLHWVQRDLGANLVVSLHGAQDEVRSALLPINEKYPLAELRQAVLAHPLPGGRVVSWAYMLLDGINDGDGDARALVAYLRGIPSRVNLLPFNPWPGADYAASPPAREERFYRILQEAGLVVTRRKSRGGGIFAACGQLGAKSPLTWVAS